MQHFSTVGLRACDTLSYWHNYVCKTYVPVELGGMGGNNLKASGVAIRFGQSTLTQIRSTPTSYERTLQNIKTSDHGDYLLSFLTAGKLRFDQCGRTAEIGAGDLCLFDTARPYQLHFLEGYNAIHLQIPRREFDRRLPAAEKVSAMRVAADGRYARLAGTMMKSTIELIGDTSPAQLAPALIDLIALAFDESFSELAKENSRYAKIVSKAQEAIFDYLHDADFDLSTIPDTIGVSTRTLNRAFAHLGMTPSKWMWSQRLDAAHRMIQFSQGRSVSEVAMACGFNDFSHFSRAFKAQFGFAPSCMMKRQ